MTFSAFPPGVRPTAIQPRFSRVRRLRLRFPLSCVEDQHEFLMATCDPAVGPLILSVYQRRIRCWRRDRRVAVIT